MLVSLIATAALLTSAAYEVQMIDKKIGTGLEVGDGDVATVLYSGWLQTGYEFDTTNGKPPLAFAVGAGDVIKGWDVGVKGMKVGGKRVLLVPPAFGYGDKQAGEIPANSTLVFEVELLRVDKKGAEPKIEVKTTTPGTGAAVKSGDRIKVHYRGKFLNGLQFDASYDRNEPLEVEVGVTRLIEGFTQGLIGMKLGEKRTVTIPYPLAYKEAGRPPRIPPRTTLVFELELVSIGD